MDGYKHYIRIDQAGTIVDGFSSAFEDPQDGDICIDENAGRHFTLQILEEQGRYNYKWDGKKVIERTEEEKFDLEAYRAAKISVFSLQCRKSIEYGLKSSALGTEHEYDFDREEAQINLSGVMGAINSGKCPPVVDFKTRDAGYLPHTTAQLVQLFMDGFVHKQTQLSRFDSIRTAIKTATKDEIDAITWE